MKMKDNSIEQYIYKLVETGAFELIGDGISIQDTDFKILYQNSKHQSIIGDHAREYCYKAYEKRDHYCEGCPLIMSFEDGLMHTAERTVLTDGGLLHVEITVSPIRDKTGKIMAGIEVVRDITERKEAVKLLERSENKYRTLLKNIPQKIFYKDIKSVYILCNESYAKDLNIEPSEIIGKTDYDFYPKELAEKYRTDDKKIMDSGKISEIEEKYVVDGKEMAINTLKAPILDESGKTIGIFGIFWDITDRKRVEDKLREAAITDDLTGLLNRRGFFTLADQQCKLATRKKRTMALVYIDVDGLKKINDELGHDAGDQALVDTAKIFKKTFRESDIIARIGGDEFVVLLDELPKPNDESTIINHLQDNIKKHNELGIRKYELLISIGVAYYDGEHPCDISKLLQQADEAMYKNKNHKKY
jgi:diguanylate cyclase (GGDEF)-like protein/PAS domain S-box-containing protein